jgi:hypothetical protein
VTKFERICANIPSGTILPSELRKVCDYLDSTGYPISGCMKIRPNDFGGVRAWFGDDDVMASNFAYFGESLNAACQSTRPALGAMLTTG